MFKILSIRKDFTTRYPKFGMNWIYCNQTEILPTSRLDTNMCRGHMDAQNRSLDPKVLIILRSTRTILTPFQRKLVWRPANMYVMTRCCIEIEIHFYFQAQISDRL